MFARAILMVAAATLILPRLGYSQLQANGQNDPQTPSEVVCFLVGHGRVVQVPVKGKVKPSIKKTEPSFAMPHGPSSIVLRRLPDYQAPYVMTIASFRRGLGRTTEIFAPSGLYFGEDFQQVGEFEEDRLAGKEESFVAELAFGEMNRSVRYLLLYTRGDLVGQRMDMRGDLGLFNAGVFKLERSLEAKIQVETKPEARRSTR